MQMKMYDLELKLYVLLNWVTALEFYCNRYSNYGLDFVIFMRLYESV
jgi:hypothetical protein